MAEPVYSSFTERLYGRLPEVFRVADSAEGWPLKKYISLVGDVAGEAETLLDAWMDQGTLADPVLADAAWLPWLAQLVGVKLSAALSVPEQRDAILYASSGWQAGTKIAVAAAAKTVLTGTKYAAVLDHCLGLNPDGTRIAGTVWDVCVVTKPSETPDASLVLPAILARDAKPAGVVLNHAMYAATWDQVEAAFPTWADWDAHTWDQIESTP